MYKHKVILFHAGAGGNFLANFLVVDKNLLAPQFRIDWQQSTNNITFVGNSSSVDRRIVFFDKTVLDKIHNMLEHNSPQILLSHYIEVSQFQNVKEDVWVRKIYPKTNIFGLIKNINFKKQILEFTDYSGADFRTQVDQAFIIIDDYYGMIKQDQDCPNDLTIDFGLLYNIQYLADLFESVHGFPPDNLKIEWAQTYIDQQFAACSDCDLKDMQQIIDHVSPKDFFDVALVLFIYEKNHNTIDRNRLWTIDNLPDNVTDALAFFITNSTKYTIFNKEEKSC
jgi:hypothetical protein